MAATLFPAPLSHEDLNDPILSRLHFDRSWMAVACRYRACGEQNEDFKTLLRGASDFWSEWGADEEQDYKLERCLYAFFMNAHSIFESLGYCLYFVGAAVKPAEFTHVTEPKKITLEETSRAYRTAFPKTRVARELEGLLEKAEYRQIKEIRNILAHRLVGRRHVHSSIRDARHGRYTGTRKEFLFLPGASVELQFDAEMTQRCLDPITSLLTSLLDASIDFARNTNAADISP